MKRGPKRYIPLLVILVTVLAAAACTSTGQESPSAGADPIALATPEAPEAAVPLDPTRPPIPASSAEPNPTSEESSEPARELDRVAYALDVAAYAPFNVDGQEAIGPYVFGTDEQAQQEGFSCYQRELAAEVDIGALRNRVADIEGYFDLLPEEARGARQAAATCLAADDYRLRWIRSRVWSWNTYARNQLQQDELTAMDPCFAPVFDTSEEFVSVLVEDVFFDNRGGEGFIGPFDCRAAIGPPSPTPVPTPPTHPWYECEVEQYALHDVLHRVTNIPDDDPDGGLVAHTSPGVAAPVTEVLPDASEGYRIAGCQQNPSNNSVWWLVNDRGWVNSRYLETYVPVEGLDWRPGLTEPIEEEFFSGIIGLEAAELEEFQPLLVDELTGGTGEAVMLGEFMAVDARGGRVSVEIVGLRDDSVGGYRLDLTLDFIKDDDANAILGYRIVRVIGRAICIRGVSGSLCV